jgi:hypothetical protein
MSTIVRYPQVRTIRTKLYGVSFRNEDGLARQQLIRQCRPGDRLRLVREPGNPHDPCAVAVQALGGRQLGYLGGHLALEVSREMDAGRQVSATISKITGGGGWLFFRRNFGVNIEVTIA